MAGAEQAYRRALELSPHYATAHHWYAELLLQMGRFEEASDHYRHALAADPSFGRSHRYLATVYAQTGRYSEAVNELRQGWVLAGVPGDDVAAQAERLAVAVARTGARGYWGTLLDFEMKKPARDGDWPHNVALIYARPETCRRRCHGSRRPTRGACSSCCSCASILLVDVGPRRAAQRPCASRGRASVKDDRVYLIRNLQTWACEPAAERRNQGPPRRPKPPRLGQVLEAVVLLMMRAALVTGAQMPRDPTRKQPAAFLLPLPANEPPEARRRVVPVEAPIGDLDGQRLPLAAVGGRCLAIQSQEHDASAERGSLVAIEKRMIPADVAQIGCRHFDHVSEHRLATEGRLWSRDRRFQQRAIAHAVQSTELPDRLGVNLLNDVDSHVYAVRRPSAHDSFFIVRA